MQDGASWHICPAAMDEISKFTNRIICAKNSNYSDLPAYPALSPDLTIMDFALFPKLKRDLGKEWDQIKTQVQLEETVNRLMQGYADNPEFLNRAVRSCTNRFKECIRKEGNVFEPYIRKNKPLK